MAVAWRTPGEFGFDTDGGGVGYLGLAGLCWPPGEGKPGVAEWCDAGAM